MERMDTKQLGTLVADPAVYRDLAITGIAYRSSDVQPGNLFFCVPGERVDGHDFAADAATRGAAALAVEHSVPVDLPQLHFDDTRLALALASQAFYDDPSASLAITAVTGTNGKTTTSYLIDWICRFAFAAADGAEVGATAGATAASAVAAHLAPGAPAADTALRTPSAAPTGLIGTVETRIGSARLSSKFTTPESLDLQRLLAQMRDAGVREVCMEVSSHAIALHRVANVRFAAAAFTNLTQDHLDFHGTMEVYFEAKAALFDSPLVAARAIDCDTPAGRRLIERCETAGFTVLTSGLDTAAQVRAHDICYHATHTALTLDTPAGSFSFTYPLIGGFNVSNVALAAATASLLGFDWQTIISALTVCPQIPGRLERVWAKGISADDVRQPPIRVFVDYSHTPDSIQKALEALGEIKNGRVLLVFGCGGDRDAGKRPLMGAAALASDYAIVTSDNPRTENPQSIIADILPGMAGGEGRFEVVCDRRQAIARALAQAGAGDIVLIAGKGHEDYQIVGETRLDFDDRIVAAEELRALADAEHWVTHPAEHPTGLPTPTRPSRPAVPPKAGGAPCN
ncbi:MAG: UDP-N-acetylmuramoyl-L-alanyl-D-glutamate--2,6-diaminopimelate ligase [Coriobacteriales bacterium]|jgi:UDP-N-acetylmuramoyl-L-alanyl-D-glutamate--2,6-diaminopimelate ligase|nr:UDP-N-acetylmuramoyl-L-alanyl-D-glutamate--2,6-diaminopimelate ligase [Coriobacteriales bacterium]